LEYHPVEDVSLHGVGYAAWQEWQLRKGRLRSEE